MKVNSQRLMAIDPSLTCSGWALFSVSSKELLAVGKIRSLPASNPLVTRLADVQCKVTQVYKELELGSNDVLICEAQTTMRDPKAAFRVEQVRGIFETVARQLAVKVPGRINPRSVQYEVLGLKGKQICRDSVKQAALTVVQRIYADALHNIGFNTEQAELDKHQDIVDAILVGNLGLVRMDSAHNANIALEEVFIETVQKRRAAAYR